MRGQIFDWKLQEIIGFDHAGNAIYKGIDRYREYSAIRIVNFDESDQSFINQALLFCGQHENAHIVPWSQFTIMNNCKQLILVASIPKKALSDQLEALDESTRIGYMADLVQTLLYLHSAKNYVVKTIRPQSIFILNSKPHINIYSKVMDLQSWQADYYDPPQIVEGYRYSFKSDVWQLGVAFIQLLTGRRCSEMLQGNIPAIFLESCFRLCENQQLLRLIKNMVKKNPNERFKANQVLYELQKIKEKSVKIQQPSQKEKKSKISTIDTEPYRENNVTLKSERKILNLRGLQIKRLTPLEGYDSLQWLYLSDNSIKKINHLSNFLHFKGLDLSYNFIEKKQNLSGFAKLEELYLHYNRIKRIENLQRLPSLSIVYLNHNHIAEVKGLDGLPSLHKVILKHNSIRKYHQHLPFTLII